MKNHLKKFNDPISEKRKIMREKMELIKFMELKKASKKTLDRLYQEYNDLFNIEL